MIEEGFPRDLRAIGDDYAFMSAGTAAALLRKREVGPMELLELSINRIATFDPQINSVIERDYERAHHSAQRAELALKRGDHLPLLGVPITVKASFNVAGLPTNWGISAFRNSIASRDSQAIRMLRRAGAVIVGKTNVAAALSDWQCHNEIYGRTNNPRNPRLTSGGSSGGSAAALASGLTFLELGSDVAGSIRIPAHFCGVYGHRPTHGIVPLNDYGLPLTHVLSDFCVAGPMARSAEDLDIAMRILITSEDADRSVWHLNLPEPRQQRLQHFRVKIITKHPLVPTAEKLRSALITTGDELRRLGGSVSLDDGQLPDLAEDARTFFQLITPFGAGHLSLEKFQTMSDRAYRLPQEDNSLGAMGLRACIGSPRDRMRALEAQARQKRDWEKLFQDWDIVICPAAPIMAYEHMPSGQGEGRIYSDGYSLPYAEQSAWIASASLCGLPATVAPMDIDAPHLPASLQIIGAPYQDLSTIRFCQLLERHFGGFRVPSAML